MIKFVVILLLELSGPGDPPVTARYILTEPEDTRAACMLTGEVTLQHPRDIVGDLTITHADILCEPLEWWE